MPLIKILPDGKARIANSKTGEVKDVAPEDLQTYSPRLVVDYQQALETQNQAQAFNKAGVAPGDVPTNEMQQKVLEQQIASGSYKPASTADEEKQKLKYEGVKQSVDMIKKNLAEVEQSGPIGGRFAGAINALSGGGAFPEAADYESLRKSLIGPLARTISGEVGVLTDKDIARAEGLLPKLTDSKKLRENKLKNLDDMINEKLSSVNTLNKAGVLPTTGSNNDPLGLGL